MLIYYATTNNAKVITLKGRLANYNVEVEQVPFSIPEPRTDSVEEIAKQKVIYAYEKIKEPVAALDAGFWIDVLGGFPKAFVNFALETIKINGILKLMDREINRNCEFQHCLAYLDAKLFEPVTFQSPAKGTLATEIRGEPQPYVWSPLGTIFIPEGREKTLAEMTQKEYAAWKESDTKNHYAIQFGEWLKENRMEESDEIKRKENKGKKNK